MKTQRNFVIIKRLNNKQFIHTNLLLASPNCKKQLCESKASGREKERYVKQKDTKKNKFFFRVFCCGKEVTFNLDVFKKRNKKVDTYHIHKYNKHKQNQYIKSYSIFYAIRQENPQIKSLHEAAEKLCNGIFWSNTIVREEISIQFKVFAENVKIQLRYKTDGFVYR